MEVFPDYVFSVDAVGRVPLPGQSPCYYMTAKENGKWQYSNVVPRHLDRKKFEEWKTHYYKVEGWDPKTGWQKEKVLKDLGLDKAASELKAKGKLK
ncbi:Aldehyde ferredoxin oxidoreductase [anaerobic digester metagenome]|uniref:Aldehyde ferredoxin oxidoreductase n=1 Tax=anaerobic digester metagenome TaxID=1263854 RepID=A0A485LXR5_9ZZZZ